MRNLLPTIKTKRTLIFVLIFTFIFVIGSALSSVYAAAGINAQINFQGKLVDNTGLNVSDGSKTVIFSVYDVASGGTALWSETQSVTTADGIFRASLGSVTPFPSNFNFNWDGLYLGVKVGADAEMTPRIGMTAVPYAFNAQKVAGLTVQDTSGNASTSGILQVGNGKTISFGNSIGFTGTDGTTFSLPSVSSALVSNASSSTLTNKTIGSTGLTFSSATTDITTGTNEDFVLSPNGTGSISLGTTSPIGFLTLEGKTTGKALGIFNQLTGGDQDLFTASQAGVTKFKIFNTGAASMSGMLTLGDGTAANNVLRTPYGPLLLQYKSTANTWATGFYLQDVTGNIGIGSTAPGAILDVVGSSRITGALSGLTGLTLSSGAITLGGGTGSGQCLIGGASAAWGACGAGSSQWTTTGTNIYYSTGNVGIGTTLPAGLLMISGSTTTAQGAALVSINQTGTADLFTASTAGTTRFVINNNGNVGIGSTVPIGLLNIDGKATGKALVIFNETNGQDIFTASASGITKFTIANDGSVVLGRDDSSSPTSATLRGGNGIGTDAVGANLLIQGGNGTGVGGSGYISLQTALGSSSQTITLDATSSTHNNPDSSTLAWSHVTGSSTNRIMIVGVSIRGNTAVNSITYGGQSLTKIRSDNPGGDIRTEIWYLIAPTTGSNTITVTAAGTATIEAGAVTFSGVGQTAATALGTDNGATGATGSPSVNVTSAAGQVVVDVAGTQAQGANLTIGANQTSNWNEVGTGANGASSYEAGAGTVTMSWTSAVTTEPWAISAVPLKPGGGSSADALVDRIRITSDGNIGIGTTTPITLLDIEGKKTGQALVQFNELGNQDLFTASASGVAKFSITNAGGIKLAASEGTSSQCLLSGGVGAASTWGSCGGGGGGTNYFDQANGLTFIGNTTTDFAIGGNSTGSGKFVFGNMNSGTPTATFSGDLIINNKPTTANANMQRWTKTTGTAGTIGGGTAGVASISASVVYNGSLYVGTMNANNAEIYRYDGEGAGTWTKVSGTAGTVGGNATTAIDMISSLTVYDGYLYAGTTEPNAAEVYRYNGSSSWTQLNVTATAGKFLTNTAIDGVQSMTVFGGRLFIGTREPAKAEVYMYNGGTTWIAVNGTAGTFVATNSITVDAVTQMVIVNNQLVIGTLRTGDADVLRWNGIVGGSPFFALNLASATGSYLIDNAAQTGTNEVTAMTIWAGKLVIAIRRAANQADILMYQEPPGGAAPINSWTRLNSAAGTVGTANIDSVTAMTTYGGRLYVGTTEPNGAEIYRYDEAKSWTKVSQNTAGMISSGGTGSIDSIATLISYNHNSLFAGTLEGTTAEGYSYSVSIDQSYSLKFSAGASQGGGVQNNNQNLGQIFFVASLSANLNNKAGNTGAFVFSHSIVTNNGSYDVAEDYPTRDDTLEPGDVVSIDTNERGFVKKSEGDYDYTAIGVYSEKPALRLSQDEELLSGGRAIPVALAGRVPVKVTTENGEIKSGDPLTPSSISGVAMKAKKSGLIIGQALEGYDGEGVGKVLTYIKSASYQGSIAQSFVNISPGDSSFGKDVLDALVSQDHTSRSEVVSDTIIAGLQIVTPLVTAREVRVNTITIASGSALVVSLGSDGRVIFGDSEQTGIVFDNEGNATFAGTITAKSIKADSIEGLEIITGKISSLNQVLATVSASVAHSSMLVATQASIAAQTAVLSAQTSEDVISSDMILHSLGVTGTATFSGDLRVKGSGLIEGILTIIDSLTTNNLLVNGMASFFDNVVFKKDVTFEGRTMVSKDMAGFATVHKGDSFVDIRFEKEYETLPVVNATVVMDNVTEGEDQIKADDQLVNQDTDFVVVHRSKKGFTILLKRATQDDLQFSWTTTMVKDPMLFRSDITPTRAPPH